MIIGTGLVANAMNKTLSEGNFCVFAAGVSNSACTDSVEFARERARLQRALTDHGGLDRFIYFSTCSIYDPSAVSSMYVSHKMEMERLVAQHRRHLIFRLPQVAGRTPNPHTLLNYLFARIARSEKFNIWAESTRNVIDVDDIAAFVRILVVEDGAVNETINVASPQSVKILDIVHEFEGIIAKPAVYDVLQRGTDYSIDCSRIQSVVERTNLNLEDDYLGRVLRKYYG
jgi:nucleoside-diphosphate-sugar epimerase